MVRHVRVATRLSLLSLMLALPAAAHAAPPVCPDGVFDTPPNTPLDLPSPPCTNVMDPSTLVLVTGSGPSHGTITTGSPNVYRPAASYHGVDQFRYRVDAANGSSNDATVTVLVDTAPDCPDRTATVQMGQRLVLPDVDCTDADVGDDFDTFVDTSTQAHGTIELPADGSVIYTPPAGFVGTDSFTYYAVDELGLDSFDGRVTITVTSPPVATAIPTPPPVAQPKDTTAPAVTLKSAAKPLKQTLAKGLSIVFGANENATAKLTLSLDKASARKLGVDRKATGPVTVGTLDAALTPGPHPLVIKLSSKARKALKSVKKVKLTVTAVVSDTAGNRTTRTLSVTIRR